MSTISPKTFYNSASTSNRRIRSQLQNKISKSTLVGNKTSPELNLNAVSKKCKSGSTPSAPTNIFQFRLSRSKRESHILNKSRSSITLNPKTISIEKEKQKELISPKKSQVIYLAKKNIATVRKSINLSNFSEKKHTANTQHANSNKCIFGTKIPVLISRMKRKKITPNHNEFVFENTQNSVIDANSASSSIKLIDISHCDETAALNSRSVRDSVLKDMSGKSSADSLQSTILAPISEITSAHKKVKMIQTDFSLNENDFSTNPEFAINESLSSCSSYFESIVHNSTEIRVNLKEISKNNINANEEELTFNKNNNVDSLSLRFDSITHNNTEISSSSERHSATSYDFNSIRTSNVSKESVCVTNESCSEYRNDSTNTNTVIDESFKSNNTCVEDMQNSIKEITSPVDITKVNVPYSSKSKKHFCIFCKTLQTNFARHLLLKHKNEKEIKGISKLPKKHVDRVKVFNKLRKEGDFLHNTSKSLNTGVLIVSRQQHARAKNEACDYVCCKFCKAFYSKRTLSTHLSKCGNSKKNDRTNIISSRRLTQYAHEAANEKLKTTIFPILRDGVVPNAIRYDELIVKYGNKLSEKYSHVHQHDMIRAQLRLLGRFTIAVMDLCPEVKGLKDIYKPQVYDTCIKALRKVSRWNNNSMWFEAPAVAQSLTSLIKKCGQKQKTEFIKTQQEDLIKDLDNFLLLWNEEVPILINKKAAEDQANKKRDKKVVLPSKEDIKKLYTFLKNKMTSEITILEDKFNIHSWTELIKSTLIFIQIFNRRRAGEIERLTIANYKNKEVITDNMDEALLRNISKESLSFAKQFVRILIRGKLGRTVSVLLNPLSVAAIEIINKYRVSAEIPTSNEFIFCKKRFSKLSKQYFRACPLLNQFSLECGADLPESLRGTTLRKHIATYTSLLNIEEAAVDTLANFMGHHKDVHKTVYRMSIPVAEITCVSKLLMNAIVDEGEEDDNAFRNPENGDAEGEAEEDSSADESEVEVENFTNKKRRSTSPYGKTKRLRWSDEEKQAISTHFGCVNKLPKLPSLLDCRNIIEIYPVLRSRTPQQIKSWIDNQRRHK